MLSTAYRLRLEEICQKIIKGENVELNDMIWAEKLSKSNRSAATILRRARRLAENPEMDEDSLDGFLNAMDLGGFGNERYGISGFNSPDEIADFFRRSDEEDWRTRD